MGFRFRKSIKLGGGIRLNFSKSGIGISGGVKGLRLGIGPKGTRVSAGVGPLRYQKNISSGSTNRSVANWSDSSQLSTSGSRLNVSRPTHWHRFLYFISAFETLAILSAVPLKARVVHIFIGSTFYYLSWRYRKGSAKVQGYNLYKQYSQSMPPESGVPILEKAYSLYPNWGIWIRLSEALFQAKRYKEAAPGLMELQNELPSPETTLLLAACLVGVEDWDSALQYLEAVDEPEESDSFMKALILKTECYLAKKEYDRVLEIVRTGMAKRGEQHVDGKRHLRIAKARVLAATGKIEQAMSELKELISEAPSFALATVELEKISKANSRTDAA